MLQHCCNPHATRGERAPVEPVLLSQVRSERRFRALAAVAPGRAALRRSWQWPETRPRDRRKARRTISETNVRLVVTSKVPDT